MPLWQRLLITLVTMLLTSLAAGLLWRWLFNTDNSELSEWHCRRSNRSAGLGALEKD
jgi:hypothetical protein